MVIKYSIALILIVTTHGMPRAQDHNAPQLRQLQDHNAPQLQLPQDHNAPQVRLPQNHQPQDHNTPQFRLPQDRNLYPGYVPERQQFFQYDFPILDPQYYKPQLPKGPPQLILYHGGAPGQFLLQPGSPPGNFLIPQPQPHPGAYPQPGPNVISRDSPQPPILVAGYPKPAHIPPIEKDAEEVPTNPSKIPPMPGRRPEKLETLDQPIPDNQKQPNLYPGQRFFFLNGETLYPNYQFPIFNNNAEKFSQALPDSFLRNAGALDTISPPRSSNPDNVVLLNPPYLDENQETHPYTDLSNYELYKINSSDGDNENDDSVVINAKDHDDTSKPDESTTESEEKSGEPTISQAQPSATALAGPGGVAAAAPRGTAFAGKEGVAISSPHATAVAGPTKQSEEKDKDNKDQKKDKRKKTTK